MDEGNLVITSGTASVVSAQLPVPALDPTGRIPLTPSWSPNHWELEGVVGAAGASLSWASDALGFADVASFLEAASVSSPGANGVRFRPHLGGATSPRWRPDLLGSFSALSISASRHDLARSVVEGVCGEIAANCRIVVELAGERPRCRFLGGLTRHPVMAQTLASMLNRPIEVLQLAQPTAIGAAIRAADVVGWSDVRTGVSTNLSIKQVDPDRAAAQAYQDILELP
ncbi:FGGY-family carbohydrate kinase [Marmoricola sp. URHA0025 HA25]